MFSKWKKMLAGKKANNEAFEESRKWKNNAALQNCLQAMRGSCTLAPVQLHEAVICAINIALAENIWTDFPGTTDFPADFHSGMVYVVWNDAHMPVLTAHANAVKENIGSILCVNHETFLVAQSMDRIIWFREQEHIKLYSIT